MMEGFVFWAWIVWCGLAGYLGGRLASTFWSGVGIAFLLDAAATWLLRWHTSSLLLALEGLALLLWDWWRRRGRRDVERAAGVVRDLGHRLTVVPAPAGT